jgi:hypothetical protein
MVYRYGHLPYRYDHPGYRYGTWANDMGDDSIDMVILHIDTGYLVTLRTTHLQGEWAGGSLRTITRTTIGCARCLAFRVNAHTDARTQAIN